MISWNGDRLLGKKYTRDKGKIDVHMYEGGGKKYKTITNT